MKLNNNRVLVGMSGGVDSSVAAGLLLELGYEVIGVTIEPFKFDNYYNNEELKSIKSSVKDASNVCGKLGIEHITVDYFEYFQKNVVQYFVNEYLEGKTPNPCVKCNPIIKWGKLIETADRLNAQYISTGHYAGLEFDNNSSRYILKRSLDKSKDQSYFLWGLRQDQLARTIFPLSDFSKSEVRIKAHSLDLPVHDKRDSQEVCFIADNNYHKFLQYSIPDVINTIGEGNIVFRGKVVGRHKGYPFYTIGQRKGLGLKYSMPLFVKKIDAGANTIEVSTEEGIYQSWLTAHSVNLIKFDKIDPDRVFNARTRYKDPGSEAQCYMGNDGKIRLEFINKRRAITPGQSVVIYDGDDVVGGGIIEA